MLSRRAAESLNARVFDSATRHGGCRLDAYREGSTYYVDIDLPGIDPATIDVTADQTALTVRAERKPARHGQGPRSQARNDGLHLVGAEPEMTTSTCEVALSSPMDTDRLDASYDSGVLTLRIPLAAPVESRQADSADDLAEAA